MKKILYTLLILILAYNNMSGQNDSTIASDTINIQIPKIRKNVLSLGIFIPRYDYGYGKTINHCGYIAAYERNINKTNSIVFTIGGGYTIPTGFPSSNFQYCSKVSYRFYNRKINGFIHKLFKQQKPKPILNGFYFSIDATMRGENAKFFDYYNYRFGLGGGFGYQYLLFGKIAINYSISIYLGYCHIYEPFGVYDMFCLFPVSNINLGFAF